MQNSVNDRGRITRLMKFVVFIFISLTLAGQAEQAAQTDNLFPASEDSLALKHYLHGPRSELAKLLYLMDRFRTTEFAVVYNGNTYDAPTAVKFARQYLAKNYGQEKAENWIQAHAYRVNGSGPVILVKFTNGKPRPLRDVLLGELESLKRLS